MSVAGKLGRSKPGLPGGQAGRSASSAATFLACAALCCAAWPARAELVPVTRNGLPQQVIPEYQETGAPTFITRVAPPPPVVTPVSTDPGSSGDTSTGSNVGDSLALTKMEATSWGGQAAVNAQSVGLNPSALAATCLAESGCNGSQATVPGQSAQGTFQMQPAAYKEGIARAEKENPALASQIVPGDAGRYDPVSSAIAASGYLLQGADALQSDGVTNPTVLQTRGYFVFGPGPGPQVAQAPDTATLSSYISQEAMTKNHWPSTETVGQWRASVVKTVGDAANQSVLSR